MKVYTVLQKASDPELEPYVLEESFDNYDDAVTAAKATIIDAQSNYADETNIVTNFTNILLKRTTNLLIVVKNGKSSTFQYH